MASLGWCCCYEKEIQICTAQFKWLRSTKWFRFRLTLDWKLRHPFIINFNLIWGNFSFAGNCWQFHQRWYSPLSGHGLKITASKPVKDLAETEPDSLNLLDQSFNTSSLARNKQVDLAICAANVHLLSLQLLLQARWHWVSADRGSISSLCWIHVSENKPLIRQLLKWHTDSVVHIYI